MATKGGGLLGGADAQLVQGAFRAEMANTSPNMSGVYAMQAENVGNLQTAIQDIFYATNKSNNDLYNDVKEKSSLILADIESGTFSDDNSIGLYTNAINDLRNKMKSIPRGKEGEAERAKVRAQLAKMKADTALGEGVITEIATLLKNDQVNMPASTDAMVVFQSILDDKAKREIINGELVYSTTDAQGNIIKLNHNELNKKFIKKDHAVEAGALKASNGFSKTGLQGGRYDFVGAANLYESIMTTENGVLHLINKPFGSMKISFVEALKGGDSKLVGEMIGALNNIGGFDVEGDSRPDKITQANISKLVSTLTNQNDKNFNLATTKRVASAFYADNDGRAQHKKGFDIFNAKQNKLNEKNNSFVENTEYGGYGYQPTATGGDPVTGKTAFTNVTYIDKIARRNALLNLDELPGEHFTYRYDQNNGWQAFNIEDNSFERDVKGSDIARIEGLYNENDGKAKRSYSYFDAKRSTTRRENLPPEGSEGISVKALKVKKAKDFQKAILNIFNKDILDDYAFEDVTRVTEFGTDRVSGQVKVKSKDGSFNKIFNIGNKANDELAIELNNLFSDYLAPDPLNPNNN